MADTDTPDVAEWAIVELFGHRQLAGQVREVLRYGTSMMRIDVPEVDGIPASTHYYGGSSIYGEHPVDEETARLAAKRFRPAAVMPAALPAAQSCAGLVVYNPRYT